MYQPVRRVSTGPGPGLICGHLCRAPPGTGDPSLTGRGPGGGLEQADDLARLLGGDGQRGPAVQGVGDVGVDSASQWPRTVGTTVLDGRAPASDPRDAGGPRARRARRPGRCRRARRASSWGSMPDLTNPPSVPRIHHRGRSSRQMRLVSTWNRTSSNSRTIRPWPPLSTPGQGAGSDPGRQPPARPQAELERLVDQVGPPVVEDRPGLAACRARSAARRSGRPRSRRAAGGRSGPGRGGP